MSTKISKPEKKVMSKRLQSFLKKPGYQCSPGYEQFKKYIRKNAKKQ